MFVLGFTYIILLLFYLLLKNCRRPPKYPPGPLLLPIIGSWYTFPGTGAAKKVPEWRKKYGNIIGHKFGFKYIVVVTGVQEVINGLKHPNFQNRVNAEFFQSRTLKKKLGYFNTHGEQYSVIRRFTLRYMSFVFNEKLETIMEKEMKKLFSKISSGKIILINQRFLKCFLHTSLEIFINVKSDDFQEETDMIQDLTNESFQKGRITGIEFLYGWFGKYCHYDVHVKASTYTMQFLQKRFEEHKATFNSTIIRDFIDSYLVEQVKEKEHSNTEHFTDEELLVCLSDLIQTSGESSSNTAAFILLQVSLNPIVQDKIHEELDTVLGKNMPTVADQHRLPYCQAVIKEVFRLNPLVPFGIAHAVSESTEFYGYDLPKNSSIFFVNEDNFKNPDIWIEPDKFRPERFINGEPQMDKLTNFGLGKRSCVAQILAKNTLSLFVMYFFQKYSIKLPPGEIIPDTFSIEGFTKGCKPFHLILNER